ncbi:MAG: hypothetical protein LBI70_00435 [Rickettsiales bacterium]|jgi:hypothetical protein|nr:hypothetical protein [Rickettsiales bacterium]
MNIRELEEVIMNNILVGKSKTFRTLRTQYEAAIVNYYRFRDNEIFIGFSTRGKLQLVKEDIIHIANWEYASGDGDSTDNDDSVQPFLIMYHGIIEGLEIYYHQNAIPLAIDSDYSEVYERYTRKMKNRGRMLMRDERPDGSDPEEEKLLDEDIYSVYPEDINSNIQVSAVSGIIRPERIPLEKSETPMGIGEFEKALIDDMLLGKSETFRILRAQYETANIIYRKFTANEIVIGFSTSGNSKPIKKDVAVIANWDYSKLDKNFINNSEISLYLSMESKFIEELKICYDGATLDLDSDYCEIYRLYNRNMKYRRRVQVRNDEPDANDPEEYLFADDICTFYSRAGGLCL